jgi:hypothetical protein
VNIIATKLGRTNKEGREENTHTIVAWKEKERQIQGDVWQNPWCSTRTVPGPDLVPPPPTPSIPF